MATIANLDINLGARTSKLDSGLKRAERGVSRFRSKVSGIGGSMRGAIGGMVAGATAALGLYAAISKVKQAFSDLDDIAKFGRQIEESAGNVKAWNMQARLSGTSSESAKKGMLRFVRILGEAKDKGGEAAKSFERLGLNVDELVLDSPIDAFGKFADAVNKGETVAIRSQRAYGVLGRQADEMATVIAEGSRGIRAAQEDIKNFGGEHSNLDLNKIQHMNDQWTRLGERINIVFEHLAIELSPAMSVFIDQWTQVDKSSGSFANNAVGGMSAMGEAVLFVNNTLAVTVGLFKGVASNIGMIGVAVAKVQAFASGKDSDFAFADTLHEEMKQMNRDATKMITDVFDGTTRKIFEKGIRELEAKLAASSQLRTGSGEGSGFGTGSGGGSNGKFTTGQFLPDGTFVTGPSKESPTSPTTRSVQTPGSVGALERGSGAQALINQIRGGGAQSEINKLLIQQKKDSKELIGAMEEIGGTVEEAATAFKAALAAEKDGLW